MPRITARSRSWQPLPPYSPRTVTVKLESSPNARRKGATTICNNNNYYIAVAILSTTFFTDILFINIIFGLQKGNSEGWASRLWSVLWQSAPACCSSTSRIAAARSCSFGSTCSVPARLCLLRILDECRHLRRHLPADAVPAARPKLYGAGSGQRD